MIIYFHEPQNKWVWMEFMLIFYSYPLPRYQNKEGATQKITNTERKKIRMGDFFRGNFFLGKVFPVDIFFLGGFSLIPFKFVSIVHMMIWLFSSNKSKHYNKLENKKSFFTERGIFGEQQVLHALTKVR